MLEKNFSKFLCISNFSDIWHRDIQNVKWLKMPLEYKEGYQQLEDFYTRRQGLTFFCTYLFTSSQHFCLHFQMAFSKSSDWSHPESRVVSYQPTPTQRERNHSTSSSFTHQSISRYSRGIFFYIALWAKTQRKLLFGGTICTVCLKG